MNARGNEPFDRVLRAQARLRALRLGGGFLEAHARDELLARDAMLPPPPAGPVLSIGGPLDDGEDGVACDIAPGLPDVVCEEDRLPFADGVFARVRSLFSLHGVNDLPGALLLARRALMRGGRFAAVFPGGVVVPEVRAALLAADASRGGVAARVGPTVDPAEAAGLLVRAGFVEPVTEVVMVKARYPSLAGFARDARAHGATGWLAARDRRPMTRGRWAAAESAFAAGADADGKVPVSLDLLFLSARVG
jgi:SAM-dependent methyltransferase